MTYRFGWHLWDASTTQWRIIQSNLQLYGSPCLLGKSGRYLKLYLIDLTDRKIICMQISVTMFILLIQEGFIQYHSTKCYIYWLVCSWFQACLIKNIWLRKLASSGVNIFQYFYFMEDNIMIVQLLHHINGQERCSSSPHTDSQTSEIGNWAFSVFHSYYGLSVWFPDVIKHLQSDEYASRVKHFRNEEVSHFVFNFTLENQIHSNGQYINDRFRVFLISWLCWNKQMHV